MKNERKAWLILFGFLLIIGLPLCIFNITIDCANQLHISQKEIPEAEIAKAIMNGEQVYFPTHPNERLCKEELIKVLPKHFDTVAIGASLQMTLNQDMLGLKNGEFYNLGVSAMNLRDYLNTLGMMKVFGKDAGTYIFLLHIDVFLPNLDERHKVFDVYGNRYIDYPNGKNIPRVQEKKFSLKNTKELISNAFSISYFKDNLKFFLKHGKVESFIIGGEHPEYAHYMTDGSWVYGTKVQQTTVKDVLEDINKQGSEYMPSKHVDSENFVLFDKIISDLLKHEKKIILYFPPYCPSLYEAYPPQNSPCFKEIEDFISQYENNENITIKKQRKRTNNSKKSLVISQSNVDIYQKNNNNMSSKRNIYDINENNNKNNYLNEKISYKEEKNIEKIYDKENEYSEQKERSEKNKNFINKININRLSINFGFCCVRSISNVNNFLMDEGMKLITEQLDILNLFRKLFEESINQNKLKDNIITKEMSDECKKNVAQKLKENINNSVPSIG